MASLTAYLAGPYHNCNPKQQTEWRKQIKTELAAIGHKAIDPANHVENWTPLKEMVDLEKSDLVIANMWKESIGTVLGIVQAVNAGKPVILIDPNYLDSHSLREMVGATNVVHTLEGAIQKLQREIEPLFETGIEVVKRRGTTEPFKRRKLQNKLNAVCTDLGIEGSPLPVIVSHRVQTRIRSAAGASSKIESSRIVELVFEELTKVLTETDRRYADDLDYHATILKEEWGRQNKLKDDRRALEDLSNKELELRAELRRLVNQNRTLQQNLEKIKAGGQVDLAFTPAFDSVHEAVSAAATAFADSLVFDDSDKAVRAAKDCNFVRPDEVYAALDLLAQYAEMRRSMPATNPSTGGRFRVTGLKEWLKENDSSVEYAATESKSTRSNEKTTQERTVRYRGKEYLLLKHLKIGGGTANAGCRIHFELLSENEDFKILIGHVGKHLSLA